MCAEDSGSQEKGMPVEGEDHLVRWVACIIHQPTPNTPLKLPSTLYYISGFLTMSMYGSRQRSFNLREALQHMKLCIKSRWVHEREVIRAK